MAELTAIPCILITAAKCVRWHLVMFRSAWFARKFEQLYNSVSWNSMGLPQVEQLLIRSVLQQKQ